MSHGTPIQAAQSFKLCTYFTYSINKGSKKPSGDSCFSLILYSISKPIFLNKLLYKLQINMFEL